MTDGPSRCALPLSEFKPTMLVAHELHLEGFLAPPVSDPMGADPWAGCRWMDSGGDGGGGCDVGGGDG